MPAADRSRWASSRARELDPWREHDACGVGFVARASGHRSADIARLALQALARVAHRGAAATDRSGDGAGLLTQIPAPLFYREAAIGGIALAPGQPFAVGAFFLPREHDALGCATSIIEEVLQGEGLPVLAWRDVPLDVNELGAGARRSCPTIRQAIVAAPVERGRFDETTWERSLYLARRTIERRIADAGPGLDPFFVCSLSCRTLVYKALLTGTQLARFFPDLASSDYETALAVFHQRYSTNTSPSWALAQPFRLLAHNGEINTLWGNRNAMRAREPALASPLWGARVDHLRPVIWAEGSDSTSLDNALELLVRSGRDPVHALMMLVPEAHEGAVEMEPALRGFYEFHECLVEPWDGPAALAFSDGVFVGSALDRNGLRPCRYKITRDGLVVAGSESGLVDLNAADVVESGRLGPGELLVVDTRRKAILRNGEAKREVARRRPYSRWAARGIRLLRPTAAVPDAPPTPEPERVARQMAFGWSFEDLRYVLKPMGSAGHDAVWSMGDDTPIPPLARIPPGLYAYLRQRFAQVTNPAIDPLRETLVMSLRMHIGRRGSLLADRPAGLRLVRNEHPVLLAAEIAALRTGVGAQVVTLDTTWSASAGVGGGPDALRTALDGLCRSAGNAVREGAGIVILSDRATGRERAPLPMLLAVGAVHQHLLEHGLRTRLGLIAEAGDAWDVHHFAALIGYGAEAVHPWLALEAVQVQVAEDDASLRFRAAAEQGLLKVLSKMGISTLSSYCGAQIFEALGLGAEVIDTCFPGTVSSIGGVGFAEIAEDVVARHQAAYGRNGDAAERALPDHGRVRYRRDGEDHGWSPPLVTALQREGYASFRAKVAARRPAGPRDLLAIRAGTPIAVDQVEPVEAIRQRFICTAMSLGALSPEAHATLAIGMNRMGARSNSGEGGEDPDTYVALGNGDRADNKIKQVASGRFGVTTHYLVRAEELGLAETQALLIENGLRHRIEVRTDGGLRTGRDVVIAALLGAETYGFGTASLVAIGCAMARQCHLNSCPTGIATQRADLRAKFRGTPEQVVAYFTALAEDVRHILAGMGHKSLDEIVGRVDLLERVDRPEVPRAQMLDLSLILADALGGPDAPRRRTVERNDRPGVESLDEEILRALEPRLAAGRPFAGVYDIGNHHLTVGARIAGRIAQRHGNAGLPPGAVRLRFRGSAGQSFAAFALPGMQLEHEGEANDYVGKGLSGGDITIRPFRDAAYAHATDHNEILGNTAHYVATDQEPAEKVS